MSKATLLIVEDSKSQRAFYASVFGDQYELQFAEDGKQGIACVEQQQPDIIVLDVEMPEMNGYDVCRQLREQFYDMPILFVSAHADLEDRLTGYDAGGDDFLSKPIDARELLRKVEYALRLRDEKRQLQENGQSAFSAAMTAMTSMSEMGVLIDFIRNVSRLNNYADIANAICSTLEAYGLHGCVQVYGSEGDKEQSTGGPISELEVSILANARQLSHIYSSGSNTSFNYPHCCLVIRDMPLEDEERCGRLRDHLAILAEVAAARAQALDELHREVTLLKQRLGQQQAALVALRKQLPAASAELGLDAGQQSALAALFDRLLTQQPAAQ